MSKPRDYKKEYERRKEYSKQWKLYLTFEESDKLQKILDRKQMTFSDFIREKIRLAKS